MGRIKRICAGYQPYNPGFEQFGDQYRSHKISPDDPISDLVVEFYEIRNCALRLPYIFVIPDGCHDIIIACGQQRAEAYLSVSIQASRKFVFGENQLLFGIRFLPGATAALFRMPVNPYLDQPITIDHLLKMDKFFAEK